MAFGVNEALKRAFPDDPAKKGNGPPNLSKPFVIGAFTGCCSALVLLPSEIVKAKTQVVIGRPTSSQEILREMIKRQGLKSLFVGLDAQLCRDSSFYAVFFGGYELSCYMFRTYVPGMPDELNYFIRYVVEGTVGLGTLVMRNVEGRQIHISSMKSNLYSHFHAGFDKLRVPFL